MALAHEHLKKFVFDILPRILSHLEHSGRMSDHRCWRLRCRPEGVIKDSDLELCTEPKPAPADGQLLVKNMFIRYRTGTGAAALRQDSLSVAKRALASSERRNARIA